jgi:hypothetical protein
MSVDRPKLFLATPQFFLNNGGGISGGSWRHWAVTDGILSAGKVKAEQMGESLGMGAIETDARRRKMI